MKIVLVNTETKMGDPPLGLAYVASYARKYGNFNDIVIVDKEDDFLKKIRKEKPDLVGFTAMTIAFKESNNLAKAVKEELHVPVIVGGHHISALPNHLSNFDIGVIGEGEQTFLELLQIFEKNGKFPKEELKNVKGIVFSDNGNIKITEKREPIAPLDRVPYPARDLLKMKEYYSTPRRTRFERELGIYGAMMTARGCLYKCVFCPSFAFWKAIRFHSPEYVVGEMKELIEKHKVDAITIWDDIFVADKTRFKKIVELVETEKINEKIRFTIYARANLIDDETCKLMKRMNVSAVFFGLESGSEKILAYLKKNTVTVEQNRNAIKKCKEHGITTVGSFVFGSPQETKEDIEQTMKLVNDPNLDIVDGFPLTPLPGTDVWEYAKSKGIVSDDNFDFDLLDMKKPIFLSEVMSKEEFEKVFSDVMNQIEKKNEKNRVTKIKLKYLKYLLSPTYMRKRVFKNWRTVSKIIFNRFSYSRKRPEEA